MIVYDKYGASWSEKFPHDAINALAPIIQKAFNIKSIAFAPNGGFAIIYGENGYSTKDIPQDAVVELSTLYKQGSTIKSIAFSPNGGWVILCDTNGAYWSTNIPPEAANAILIKHNAGYNLTNIAFTPDGSDKSAITPTNKRLSQFLLASQKSAFSHYQASDNGWVLLYQTADSQAIQNYEDALNNSFLLGIRSRNLLGSH